MENWVNCFENYYVSNKGNIKKKLKNGEFKNLNCSIQNKGYKYFQLNRDKKRKNYLVHQLVAKSFIGERTNTDIDHIDRNKLNNSVENLRYVSRKENLQNTDKYLEFIEGNGKERLKNYSKYYRNKNKEKIRNKNKEYKEKNKNILSEKTKEYYKNNKIKRLEYAKQYREKHKVY